MLTILTAFMTHSLMVALCAKYTEDPTTAALSALTHCGFL